MFKKKNCTKGVSRAGCSLSFPAIPHSFLPFLLTFSPLIHAQPLALLSLTLSSPTHTYTHTYGVVRGRTECERERAVLSGREERKKKWVLKNSVQLGSPAPIIKQLWFDWAEILQGGSWHVNLHHERWRSNLEQSALISSPWTVAPFWWDFPLIFVEAN